MRSLFCVCFTFLSLLFVASSVSRAAESPFVITSHDQASIITEQDTYDGRTEWPIALRIQLNPGWHTYWKNPGDAGEPVSVKVWISGAAEGKSETIQWPTPTPLAESGLMSYVYTGDVVLPIHLHLKRQTALSNLSIKVSARWLVCKDVCIPEKGEFNLNLPYGQGKVPSKQALLFQQAFQLIPKISPWPVYFTPDGVLWIKDNFIAVETIKSAWFMPDRAGFIQQQSVQSLIVQPGLLKLALKLDTQFNSSSDLKGILVLQNKQGQRINLAVQAKPAALPVFNKKNLSFGIIVLFAFLGGIILNAMPCIFPIITMKILSVSYMGKEKRTIRYKRALSYASGILCAFVVMALIFAFFRWTGNQLGWGFQFQSLGFVIGICWLLFVIALNLLDVFTFSFALDVSSETHESLSQSLSKDFMTGLLVVVVATPCTAPFMGIAVAGALSASLKMGLMIFLSMGLGLAFPYVLLAISPILTRLLPAPGYWMQFLRQVLAFPLLISCLWLVWVVSQYGQPKPLLILIGGCIALGFAAWLLGVVQQLRMRVLYPRLRFLGYSLVILVIALTISALGWVEPDSKEKVVQISSQSDLNFSPERLAEIRENHQAVFVNITAAWCLTCMVNEKIALSSSKVQQAFLTKHIHYLVGDWTKYDASLAYFLRKHGREGVPLYLYYPPDHEGKQLPQILTPNIVLDYLK